MIYISRAQPGLEEVELRQLFGEAEVLHRRLDLSGVLAYTGQHFVQAIEGPPGEVTHLLTLIQADQRHSGMRLFCDESPAHRQFGTWSWLCLDSPDVIAGADVSLASPNADCAEAKALVLQVLEHAPPESRF
ncbi:BLUF domain-containing protein [Ideonella sp. BN130291]|uniref:BLUF domain-containing protein n=1 Tax=Ideonella sp. BN130291 TaxID=3112940 RepID=UPI002E272138|nr:BLUF domain-containing protein [Ideonella sp. BN130291]